MEFSKLSGSDYFFLTLNRHVKKQSGLGHVCRFIMKLDGQLSKGTLEGRIQNSPYFQLLQRVYLHRPIVGIPKWKLRKDQVTFPIFEHSQDTDILPDHILQRNIELHSQVLCEFDLIHISSSKTILIFSWHHLLMDGFGVNKLLASLNEGKDVNPSNFFPKEKSEPLLQQWQKLLKAKDFLKDVSRKPLLKIKADHSRPGVHFKILKFDAVQTASIKSNIAKYGSGLFETPYFLGTVARAYHSVLKLKDLDKGDIWVPVPMETRKIGAAGPILSNQHSLLFFRIKQVLMPHREALIKDLNNQLFSQVKDRVPQNYSAMISLLRYMPAYFYYQLIKGPNGDSIAGFLFSQSPSPDNLSPFLGHTLLDATAHPPNTAPPGISFQIMTFGGRLKLLIQFSESCFSPDEVEVLSRKLRNELLGDE